jgi:hypothetical protein
MKREIGIVGYKTQHRLIVFLKQSHINAVEGNAMYIYMVPVWGQLKLH